LETALRQAICESPTDDLPKLVFADWLDEQSRYVEAMFIRHYVLFGGIDFGNGKNSDGGGGGDGAESFGGSGGGYTAFMHIDCGGESGSGGTHNDLGCNGCGDGRDGSGSQNYSLIDPI
jgi:uncharacterized protein (TIGR02996 family)